MLVMIPFTTVIVLGTVSPDKKVPVAPMFCVAIVPRPRFVRAPDAVDAPVPPRRIGNSPAVICEALIAMAVLTELVRRP